MMLGQITKIERHSSLSCVSVGANDTLNYWDVKDSGNNEADLIRGRELLGEVRSFIRQHEEPMILRKIVLAIKPDDNGVLGATATAFLDGLGFMLMDS